MRRTFGTGRCEITYGPASTSCQIMSVVIVISLIITHSINRLGVKGVPLFFSQFTMDVCVITSSNTMFSWELKSLELRKFCPSFVQKENETSFCDTEGSDKRHVGINPELFPVNYHETDVLHVFTLSVSLNRELLDFVILPLIISSYSPGSPPYQDINSRRNSNYVVFQLLNLSFTTSKVYTLEGV